MELRSRVRTLGALVAGLALIALFVCAPVGAAGGHVEGADGVGRTSHAAPHLFVATGRSASATVLLRGRDAGRGRLLRLLTPVAALASLFALIARRMRRQATPPLGSTVQHVPLRRRGPPALAG